MDVEFWPLLRMTDSEKAELIRLIEAGEPLPERWRGRLFPDAARAAEVGKEYRLVYDGKMKREEVLATTPAAPWQLVRSFCEERPHEDGWKNLLVWGDNLLALRERLADQQGPDRFGTRNKIKLIYIDPPFATKQDFMKDKEKAYSDRNPSLADLISGCYCRVEDHNFTPPSKAQHHD